MLCRHSYVGQLKSENEHTENKFSDVHIQKDYSLRLTYKRTKTTYLKGIKQLIQTYHHENNYYNTVHRFCSSVQH